MYTNLKPFGVHIYVSLVSSASWKSSSKQGTAVQHPWTRKRQLNFHCFESALVSMRIRIQVFTSMRIRIQGTKSMRIHADPGQTWPSQKKLNFTWKIFITAPQGESNTRTVMPRSSATFSTLTINLGKRKNFFCRFKVLKTCVAHSTRGLNHQKWWFWIPSTIFFYKSMVADLWGNVPNFGHPICFFSYCRSLELYTEVRPFSRF